MTEHSELEEPDEVEVTTRKKRRVLVPEWLKNDKRITSGQLLPAMLGWCLTVGESNHRACWLETSTHLCVCKCHAPKTAPKTSTKRKKR